MSTVVEVAKTCQTCAMPHKFNKNSNIGICSFLSKQAERSVPITRSCYCRFHQVDSRERSNIVKVITEK